MSVKSLNKFIAKVKIKRRSDCEMRLNSEKENQIRNTDHQFQPSSAESITNTTNKVYQKL